MKDGGEHRLGGDRALVAGLQVDGVGDDAGAEAQREAGGDLLALAGGGDQDGGRRRRPAATWQRVDLGDDEVVGELGGVGGEDLGRAVLGERWRRCGGRRRRRGRRRRARRGGGPGSAVRGSACGRRRPRGRRDEDFSHGSLLLHRSWGGADGGCSDELLARRGTRRAACRPRPRP